MQTFSKEERMGMHHLNKALDFVSDPRMPYNLPMIAIKANQLRRKANRYRFERFEKLFAAFTFDVEHDFGKHAPRSTESSVAPFLRHIREKMRDVTLFVEGDLVAEHASALVRLQNDGVEIGLHGYRHELWGPSQWYLADKPLRVQEKIDLLEEARMVFESSGLKRPTIFRAPNLVADDSTVQLLAEKGFSTDSSLPSHRGGLPVPQFFAVDGRMFARIPVSVDPMPLLSLRHHFPYYRFLVCNFETLKEMTKDQFLDYVSRIVALQKSLRCVPHLMVLCHSWEFMNPPANSRRFRYCSEINFGLLENLMNSLAEDFSLKHVTVSKLSQILLDERPSTAHLE